MSAMDEFQAISAVAKQLEDEGYVALVEPGKNAVPFDLGGYRPDIVATKNNGGVIVEVKRAGFRVDAQRYLKISEEVSRHPGWSFKLVTLPSQSERPSERPALGLEQLKRRFIELQGKATASPEMAGMLMPYVWTLYIAALRLLLSSTSELSKVKTDLSAINLAYSYGLLDHTQFVEARRLLEVRNTSMHTFDSEPSAQDAKALTEQVGHLFAELEKGEAAGPT